MEEHPNINPVEGKSQRRKSFGYALVEIAQMVLLALGIYLAVDVVVGRVRVEKTSMEPTVRVGEVLMVNKLAYTFGKMERGDILTFHYPLDTSFDYIKRVIGLPGDEVRISGGEVYVNGAQLEEPYIHFKAREENVWQVPMDSIFVMGDNREFSADSRSWGFVPLENVIGKALTVYWPLTNMRVLEHYDLQVGEN